MLVIGVGQFNPHPLFPSVNRNALDGIEFIELTEPSDTLNYKQFFKHCILHIILHEFLLFIFV